MGIDGAAQTAPPTPTATPTSTSSEQALQLVRGNVSDEDLAEIERQVAEFVPPPNFLFALPNVARGVETRFSKASADPNLAESSKTEQMRDEERAAEEMIRQYNSEYALFFSSKQVPFGNETLENWVPVHVPTMHGRAKLLLVHRDTWSLLESYSFTVRHHRSAVVADSSEVYEIYAMTPQGAALEFVSVVPCSLCQAKPAPLKCDACGAPYCSAQCRLVHKPHHDTECLTSLVGALTLKVKEKRTQLNTTSAAFREEQRVFAERNRGKRVTVRRLGADGAVLSETQEIVVPEVAAAASSATATGEQAQMQ